MKDPIIAEIRKIRKKLDRLIEKDPEAFQARIRAIERRYKDRVVTVRPRYIKTPSAA